PGRECLRQAPSAKKITLSRQRLPPAPTPRPPQSGAVALSVIGEGSPASKTGDGAAESLLPPFGAVASRLGLPIPRASEAPTGGLNGVGRSESAHGGYTQWNGAGSANLGVPADQEGSRAPTALARLPRADHQRDVHLARHGRPRRRMAVRIDAP